MLSMKETRPKYLRVKHQIISHARRRLRATFPLFGTLELINGVRFQRTRKPQLHNQLLALTNLLQIASSCGLSVLLIITNST
ncbi:hypothetical protein BDV41DRAFT_309196 [Aspergillus transmontanensis]|uniref:Uncharacterized protein n=1 Tax=Aspergillus transmontanensis TaxID=1034304 RepID=A0A5N6VVC8_9EURO|nr:hypothetical protein BDV41DRAFT_309196 [Aspergillus transmontanensis]